MHIANGHTWFIENMGWNSHIAILYMLTIYTLLLIELRIIGSRIWLCLHSFYIRDSFSIRSDWFGHSLQILSLFLTLYPAHLPILSIHTQRQPAKRKRDTEERKKRHTRYETIDKCWFAAGRLWSLTWVHCFVRNIRIEVLFWHLK